MTLVKDGEGRYLMLLPAVVARVLQQHCIAAQKRQAKVALQETLTELEGRVQVHTADLRRVNTSVACGNHQAPTCRGNPRPAQSAAPAHFGGFERRHLRHRSAGQG